MGTTTKIDHFRDLTKMVIHIDIQRLTRLYSPPNCYNKVLPSSIAEDLLKLTGIPNFH